MKQCLGGKLTQPVHENGRTCHPRPRITSDAWRTMLECQVNLSVNVHMRMPQQRGTAVEECSVHQSGSALVWVGGSGGSCGWAGDGT